MTSVHHTHHFEQVGDYVIELLGMDNYRVMGVRMAGNENVISVHNTKRDALKAIRRYQAADKRRAAY